MPLLKKILVFSAALMATVIIGFLIWMNFAPKKMVAETIIQFQRTRAGLKAKAIEIPGFRVAYLEGGFGDPLLLIHGSGEDKDNWIEVSKYLTRHYRVIAPDLPGFGESDKPAGRSYAALVQVENVKAFARALGLKSLHLGGHSLGGKISAIYAAKNPSEVKSLWLLAPAGVYSSQPSEMQQLINQGTRIPISGRTLKVFDQLLTFVMEKPPSLPRPVKELLIERAILDYELHNEIYQEIHDEAFVLEDIAEEITMPTHIVWGIQDRILHHSGADILDNLLPKSSVSILKGVGHVPMMEEPKRVAEDYIAFRQSDLN